MKELRESLTIVTLRKELAEYKQRAEAAEAKLRELEMQEPVAYWVPCDDPDGSVLKTTPIAAFAHLYKPLYAKQFPAPKQEEK